MFDGVGRSLWVFVSLSVGGGEEWAERVLFLFWLVVVKEEYSTFSHIMGIEDGSPEILDRLLLKEFIIIYTLMNQSNRMLVAGVIVRAISLEQTEVIITNLYIPHQTRLPMLLHTNTEIRFHASQTQVGMLRFLDFDAIVIPRLAVVCSMLYSVYLRSVIHDIDIQSVRNSPDTLYQNPTD